MMSRTTRPFQTRVVIESESGKPEGVKEIAILERGALRPESLGLTLAEAKHLLHSVQQSMVTHQTVRQVIFLSDGGGRSLGAREAETIPNRDDMPHREHSGEEGLAAIGTSDPKL